MAPSRIVLTFALCLSYAPRAFAQIGSIAPQELSPIVATHTVAGMVINSITGEPVRKALVSLQATDGQHAAFSDASGAFRMENVPQGQYTIQSQKPGFFAPEQQMGTTQPSALVTVSAKMSPLIVRLTPAASFVGRVVDEQEQPVEHVALQAFSSIIQNGRRSWIPTGSATTDEDGSYEMDGLSPGLYRLQMNLQKVPAFAVATQTAEAKQPSEVYAAQYYPQSPDATGAQIITVKGGQSEHADFTARRVPAFQVRGTTPAAGSGTFVRVQDVDGTQLAFLGQVTGPMGSWIIRDLPSGTWHLVAQGNRGEEQLQGEQTITIEGADVTNIALPLHPLVAVPVEVSDASGSSESGAALNLREDSQTGQQNTYQVVAASPAAQASQDVASRDQFLTPGLPARPPAANVPPGHYSVQAQSFSSNCVDSVSTEGTDLAREGLTITDQPPAPVRITLRSDCASLQVKINGVDGSNGSNSTHASLLLLSDNTLLGPIVAGTNGFSGNFANLTPASYRAYAFSDINSVEYGNPEAMRAFPATEVTLAPNQHADISVDLITQPAGGTQLQ